MMTRGQRAGRIGVNIKDILECGGADDGKRVIFRFLTVTILFKDFKSRGNPEGEEEVMTLKILTEAVMQ